jgi:hypothetical protein
MTREKPGNGGCCRRLVRRRGRGTGAVRACGGWPATVPVRAGNRVGVTVAGALDAGAADDRSQQRMHDPVGRPRGHWNRLVQQGRRSRRHRRVDRSIHPLRLFHRDQAVTALTLAERLAVGFGDNDPFVKTWRNEQFL